MPRALSKGRPRCPLCGLGLPWTEPRLPAPKSIKQDCTGEALCIMPFRGVPTGGLACMYAECSENSVPGQGLKWIPGPSITGTHAGAIGIALEVMKS